MATTNYLSDLGGGLLEGQVPGVGVLSGQLFNEKRRAAQERSDIQNALARMSMERTGAELEDYRAAGPARREEYGLRADTAAYAKKRLPTEHAIASDELIGRLARLPKEEELKWRKAARLVKEDEKEQYLNQLLIMQGLGRGIRGPQGEFLDEQVIPFLNVLPKDIDTSRWRTPFETPDSPADAQFIEGAGAQPGKPWMATKDEVVTPPVEARGLNRKQALQELQAILNADPEVLKQAFAIGRQEQVEGGLNTRQGKELENRLEVARINAASDADRTKEKDKTIALARVARSKDIARERWAASNGVDPNGKEALQWAAANGKLQTEEEQAAYETAMSMDYASRAAAASAGRVAEAMDIIERARTGQFGGGTPIPGGLPPLLNQGGQGRSGQTAEPATQLRHKAGDKLNYKGQEVVVVTAHPDGRLDVKLPDGTVIPIYPKKKQ